MIDYLEEQIQPVKSINLIQESNISQLNQNHFYLIAQFSDEKSENFLIYRKIIELLRYDQCRFAHLIKKK